MQRINKRRCRSGILSFRGFLWNFWFALFSIWNCWIIDQKLQGSRQVWWIKWQKNSISTGVERTVLRRQVTNAQRNKSCPFILSSEKAKSQRLCRWTTAELITAASKLGSVAKLKLAQRRYGSLWGKHGRRCLFHTWIRGGRSHFFRLRSCSKTFESGSVSGNFSNFRIQLLFRLRPPLTQLAIYPCFYLRNDHADTCCCRN